ncbi:MAG: hypothetical protein HY749_10915 [Gammaproteobacteria bacterium]|nr:hypothetical protein [Gammaproteobacteria bacterium]
MSWRNVLLRLFAVWLLASAAASWLARPLVGPLLPIAGTLLEALLPGCDARLGFAGPARDAQILGRFTLRESIAFTERVAIHRGETLELRVGLAHQAVPIVILVAAWCALPFASWRERAISAALGLALAALLAVTLLSVQFAGLVELSFERSRDQFGIANPPDLLLMTMIFLESGGRWLVPIVLAGLCRAALVRRASSTGKT